MWGADYELTNLLGSPWQRDCVFNSLAQGVHNYVRLALLLLLLNEEVKPLYNQMEEPELENLPIAQANKNPFPAGINAC